MDNTSFTSVTEDKQSELPTKNNPRKNLLNIVSIFMLFLLISRFRSYGQVPVHTFLIPRGCDSIIVPGHPNVSQAVSWKSSMQDGHP